MLAATELLGDAESDAVELYGIEALELLLVTVGR